MNATVVILGTIGAVILVAALSSGLLERSRLPQVLVFLALGTALGPHGLGVFDFGIESYTVQVIAVVGLVLAIFTDAVSVRPAELRRYVKLAGIVLGPGTVLTAIVTGLAAHHILDVGWAESVVLGTGLASTDPVLLRGVLRSPGTPEPARQALRIESGMNDALLLPPLLVAAALLAPDAATGPAAWAAVVLRVLVVGAGAGVLVGLFAVGALDFLRRRTGVRRDYESLYVLAVALTAFASAEALGASGFIAAFTAGVTIASLDIDLCECFYDYGEASAEMALLFTFVILGSSAIWTGLDVMNGGTLAFAAVALFSRPLIMLVALAPARLDRRSRWITIWYGPRGLASLLVALIPVFAGAPGGERLFAVTSLVVLLSIAIHGGSQVLLSAPRQAGPPRAGGKGILVRAAPAGGAPGPGIGAGATSASAGDASAAGPRSPGGAPVTALAGPAAAGPVDVAASPGAASPGGAAAAAAPETVGLATAGAIVSDEERIRLDELDRLEAHGALCVLLDVRGDRAYGSDPLRPAGSVRVPPAEAVETLRLVDLPTDRWLILLCACPDDETSLRVARALQAAGWSRARALAGGWDAWRAAGRPVESRDVVPAG